MRTLRLNKIFVGILAFLLMGMFIALPAVAQVAQPISKCTLGSDVDLKTSAGADAKILKGTTVQNGTTALAGGNNGGAGKTLAIKQWGTVCLLNTINAITGWMFIFLIAIAVIAIVIAGFMFLTAGGNTARQGTATKLIAGAVVGIVIAMLARVIPTVVTGILQ